MSAAKMGHVEYVSRNPFVKENKFLSLDERFVVATLTKVLNSSKNPTENSPSTQHKQNSLLKLNSSFSKPINPFTLQTPISKSRKLQVKVKSNASHLSHSNFSLVIASQFTLSHKLNKPNLKTPIALQMPSSNSKPQFVLTVYHYKTKFLRQTCCKHFAEVRRQKCEQSEQFSQISYIFGTNSTNHHKFSKLGAKLKKSIYK